MSRGGRRGRGAHEEEHENHERWLVSYADMITLLMVFFIVLYSSSQLNVSRYKAFHDSYVKALGASPKDPTTPQPSPGNQATEAPTPTNTNANNGKVTQVNQAALDALYKKVKDQVAKNGLQKSVTLQETSRGVIFIFKDQVLFQSGKADVLASGQAALDKLEPILAAQPQPIVIEGHTDNVPLVSAQYPTNWELSTARATNVLRYLVEHDGLPASMVSAAGYADQHPLVPNDSDAHRAENRRVEVVLQAPTQQLSAGTTTGP